jgi:hypothetical protein
MSYIERITAYFEAIAETWPRLSETEQKQFQAWKDLHPGSGNSEWPGWIAYLGAPPTQAQLSVLRGGMTA